MQFLYTSKHSLLVLNILMYPLSGSSYSRINFVTRTTRRKWTKHNFVTHCFCTLVMPFTHVGGTATFAITQKQQVSLYKVWGVCFVEMSMQCIIHSMGWPICFRGIPIIMPYWHNKLHLGHIGDISALLCLTNVMERKWSWKTSMHCASTHFLHGTLLTFYMVHYTHTWKHTCTIKRRIGQS